MKVNIPILVYSKESENNDILGLPVEDTYQMIIAKVDTNYIIISYPDREHEKTIFHMGGDIFTSPLSHEEFLELTEE